MRRKKLILKIILWVIGLGVFGYLLIIGFLLLGPSIKSYTTRTPFEAAEWKAHLEDRNPGNPIKLNMVDDLLSQHQLIGMNVAEVDQLLGKPPKTKYFENYDYVYWLGPERGVGVDSEWLGLKFQNDRVIKVDILRD